jgi:hypothetical protein
MILETRPGSTAYLPAGIDEAAFAEYPGQSSSELRGRCNV